MEGSYEMTLSNPSSRILESAMTDMEPFTMIDDMSSPSAFRDYERSCGASRVDVKLQMTSALQARYPDLNITVIASNNCPLQQFAALGHATSTLDTDTEHISRWRSYIVAARPGAEGHLGDNFAFAKFHYKWGDEDFIVYEISVEPWANFQYILKEPGKGEDTRSHCKVTDALIKSVVNAVIGDANEYVYVFDQGRLTRSKEMWLEVQKATWDKVILDSEMKAELVDIASNFFDSKDVYEQFGVPWKRGIIMHGPPGSSRPFADSHCLYDDRHPDTAQEMARLFLSRRSCTRYLLEKRIQSAPCTSK